MIMRLTILTIIAVLGVMIPLFWMAGTLTSIVYFIQHRENAACKEGVFGFTPQLGLTMADGGDAVEKKIKE
jgi:ABC-type antimicrobial peptide transport system permease subunit